MQPFNALRDYLQSRLMGFSGLFTALLFGAFFCVYLASIGSHFQLFALTGILIALALGWAFGHLIVYQMLWRTLLAIRKRQGTEVEVNSRVRILRGPLKDKIVTVYEVWDFRGQVRVDLGADMKDTFGDVLYAYQVERVGS